MRRAIAVSSDVYFYEIGGGFQGQAGLGIDKIGEYLKMFGISQKTGIDLPGEVAGTIPSPAWKAENFPNDPSWRIGDTYHTSIGQYGTQVTPIQMVRADAAIANYGTLLVPHVVTNSDLTKGDTPITLNIPKSYFDVVHEGMRAGVTDQGTAAALDIPAVKIAGKTGTAQIGAHNEYVNSWVSGFFPYDNPRYAFVIAMERAPAGTLVGAPYVGLQLFQWMAANTPEYLK
jgi:penicillin-binding protein 2